MGDPIKALGRFFSNNAPDYYDASLSYGVRLDGRHERKFSLAGNYLNGAGGAIESLGPYVELNSFKDRDEKAKIAATVGAQMRVTTNSLIAPRFSVGVQFGGSRSLENGGYDPNASKARGVFGAGGEVRIPFANWDHSTAVGLHSTVNTEGSVGLEAKVTIDF